MWFHIVISKLQFLISLLPQFPWVVNFNIFLLFVQDVAVSVRLMNLLVKNVVNGPLLFVSNSDLLLRRVQTWLNRNLVIIYIWLNVSRLHFRLDLKLFVLLRYLADLIFYKNTLVPHRFTWRLDRNVSSRMAWIFLYWKIYSRCLIILER